MMPHKCLYDFVKIACLRKICFSVYRPKCSLPVILQDFLNFNYLSYHDHFLHVVRYPWKLKRVTFVGFGQAYLIMPKVSKTTANISGKGGAVLFICCMLLHIQRSFSVIMLFWLGMVRHAQSSLK